MRLNLCILLLAFVGSVAASQVTPTPARRPLDIEALRAQLQTQAEIRLGASGLVVQRYDFREGESAIEAVIVKPAGTDEPHPAIMLVPGHSRTAYDMLPVAIRFAREGFVTMAVTQPGYGGSTGPADFVGPRTFAALVAAAERFAEEPFVDRTKLGVYGYSRGALAAAQLATRTDLFRAAVLGGGIYDFASAYTQITLPEIKENMRAEAGMDVEAIRFRSPIHDLAGLDGPVLIVHGADDANAPPEQARALANMLGEVGREHELILIAGRDHALAVNEIVLPAAAFFQRHLGGGDEEAEISARRD